MTQPPASAEKCLSCLLPHRPECPGFKGQPGCWCGKDGHTHPPAPSPADEKAFACESPEDAYVAQFGIAPADEKGREETHYVGDGCKGGHRHDGDPRNADLLDALDAMRRQRDEAIALLRELDADPHATITLSLRERNAAFLAKVKP